MAGKSTEGKTKRTFMDFFWGINKPGMSEEQNAEAKRKRKFWAFWIMIYKAYSIGMFTFIEHLHRAHYTIIHHKIDDLIPFVEIFVIPYWTWFPYLNVPQAVLFFNDNFEEFFTYAVPSVIARTVFYTVSLIWPNGLDIRLKEMPRHNFCTKLVELLWAVDPPVNVTPTIHVHDTLLSMVAVTKNAHVPKFIKFVYNVWGILICLAVAFVKQHSVIDVAMALVMFAFLYWFAYKSNIVRNLYKKVERSRFLRNPKSN